MRLNNKGFTLIEILATLSILSIVLVVFLVNINNTFSISNNKSYQILLDNIKKQTEIYIKECDNNLLDCKNEIIWQKEQNKKITNITLEQLKKHGYITKEKYLNPYNKKSIEECLKIKVEKDNYNLNIIIDDSKCLKD